MDRQLALQAFQQRAMRQGGANQSAPSPQPPAMMSKPGMDQLGQSSPDEALLIIKALIQRLKQLPPAGGESNAPTA